MRRMSQQKLYRSGIVLFFFVIVFAAAHTHAGAQAVNSRVPENQIDTVFSKWTNSTPGCAVGVSVDGQSVLQKAYGMADLEHDVKNVPDTIFEAGSVSKQFTAAAVLLLAK